MAPLLPDASSASRTPRPQVCGVEAGSSTAQYDDEVRDLLRRRLRGAAIVLTCGFLAFFVRNAWAGLYDDPHLTDFRLPHLVVAVLLGLTTLPLCLKCNVHLCFVRLRLLEAAIFGLPAAFFSYMELHRVCTACVSGAVAEARAFPAEVALPWSLLIALYGVFVPNGWRRALAVVGAMTAVPLVAAVVAAERQPLVAEVLYGRGMLVSMFLWLTVAATIAMFATGRLGLLRRAAFDARRLGSYTLIRLLGRGGMGEVHLARHRLLKRPCALKLIRPDKAADPRALARFEEEVQAAAALTHPNTIEIFDYGRTDDGTFYYVMEYLPGMNLQELVERFGPLPPARAVFLLRQITGALREAHGRGLVHRDIKPGNLFVSERGGRHDVAKLLDFGLVKATGLGPHDVQQTMDGAVVGSPLYAAPETVSDAAPGPWSDIYSLGATAYFALSGRPVFPGSNPLKVLFAHANEPVVPLREIRPEIPASLEAVVLKCLAKEPSGRYESVAALDRALAACDLDDTWTADDADAWWSDVSLEPDPVDEQAPLTPDELTAATAVMLVR